MKLFLHAWFDDGSQFYPVVWDGKRWNPDKDKRRIYKRQSVIYQLRDRFLTASEQLTHNIHSVEVRIAH